VRDSSVKEKEKTKRCLDREKMPIDVLQRRWLCENGGGREFVDE